ncbi:hypothetical protein RFI_06188 [Reticulomyxa filosa]|uniref:FAD-binding FR-type domain-containing protein n=1 Tax=Reticulomyxa filosa TaxID=46433 RepID=X6NXA2_RETFI|nr:hypothetical protein RFI_06188 [Reticulomyxa filosa]|eukprot:ETO30930.1 hypothetical protein RFI_06188 [Reticulomyxa filosa]
MNALLYFTSIKFVHFLHVLLIWLAVPHCASAILITTSVKSKAITGYVLLFLFLLLVMYYRLARLPSFCVAQNHKKKTIFVFLQVVFVAMTIIHIFSSRDSSWNLLLQESFFGVTAFIVIVVILTFYCYNHFVRYEWTEIVSVTTERPNCLVLTLVKPKNFQHKCGQYMQLCVPQFSKHDRHYLFITSPPEDLHLQCHIFCDGIWGHKMLNALTGKKITHVLPSKYLDLLVSFVFFKKKTMMTWQKFEFQTCNLFFFFFLIRCSNYRKQSNE